MAWGSNTRDVSSCGILHKMKMARALRTGNVEGLDPSVKSGGGLGLSDDRDCGRPVRVRIRVAYMGRMFDVP